jgi:hypothetical protein
LKPVKTARNWGALGHNWGSRASQRARPLEALATNFKRSNRLYRQNQARDRDHDGIACEKK